MRPLPAPELVSLLDDRDGPYRNSPDGWWTPLGGAQDPVSGVVYFPPGSNQPPSRFRCEHP